MKLRTCVSPRGCFVYGIHKPSYTVSNFRKNERVETLGALPDGTAVDNGRNFPAGEVAVPQAEWVYEIPNPFPFRGTTYIDRRWADRAAKNPHEIGLPKAPTISFGKALRRVSKQLGLSEETLLDRTLSELPDALLLTLAAHSADPAELVRIAHLCCEFVVDPDTGDPIGVRYEKRGEGEIKPRLKNHAVFETLVNNPYLPDRYKRLMVLKPGAQGGSEIVGEWEEAGKGSHVYEYLRRNSYIAGGHYASNMADDAVRYRIRSLTANDMRGLRHLYYQRTFVRLAEQLSLPVPERGKALSAEELESIRGSIAAKLRESRHGEAIEYDGTIWGWNFGFDFAPSSYRLNASHQQIHQQYAMTPKSVSSYCSDGSSSETGIGTYACGDLITEFIEDYFQKTNRHFFENYLSAIQSNRRTDQREGESDLVVFEDDFVMAFVPKAQVSQWELQIMTKQAVGNILEADIECRNAIDMAIWNVQRILEALGARMVTTIEYAKRFTNFASRQHLIYDFLPKLPEAPGTFSEAQLRWVSRLYPEDFAVACRRTYARMKS